MLVRIQQCAGVVGVEVEEPDDLSRLHLEVVGVGKDAAAAALIGSGSGYLAEEPGTAWLSTTFLRESGVPPASQMGDDRPERWQAMLAYAIGRGWLDETGEFLQVHVICNPGEDPHLKFQ